MKAKKETEEKIAQLQLMEQNLQNLLIQKQTFQAQAMEIENAVGELNETKEDAYKVIGNVMLKEKKENLIKDLQSRKEVLDLRLKNLEKQESKIREKATQMQNEVVKELRE